MSPSPRYLPLDQRGPLRVLFCITSMPVGGAETLLVNLVRRLDRKAFAPELCCLKELGPLGEVLAREIPTTSNLLSSKRDIGVLGRLTRLMRDRRIDAVITVGAGDKMFWGRLAAWRAGVPVVASALHSTGWPDGIGRLNRMLTPLTDAFIGVATAHGRHLVDVERFPASKVHVIPNGVDTERFRPRGDGEALRRSLGIPTGTPLAGIVAALRPEKNHAMFLNVAAAVRQKAPSARFVIVGDGPERAGLEALSSSLGLEGAVHWLGTRADVPEIVSMLDVFLLTSKIEANPVSILEALSSGRPVVATDVGSVAESVRPGVTGYLVPAGDVEAAAERTAHLLQNPLVAQAMGRAGRDLVTDQWSLDRMVGGYERLIRSIYSRKAGGPIEETQVLDSPRESVDALEPVAIG